MIKGVKLPTGETANQSESPLHKPNVRLIGGVTLGILFGFGAAASALGTWEASSASEHEVVEIECSGQESLCLDESLDQTEIRVELPIEPVTLFSPTATSPPTTQEAPTTTLPRKSCDEIVESVTERVPVPADWQFVCTTQSINIDGLAEPSRNVITLYFGDPGDTNEDWQHTVAHEIGHAWQDELGILKEGYSNEQLERQADYFAFAFGYRKGNSRDSRAGALAVCRLFAEHGANACGLV